MSFMRLGTRIAIINDAGEILLSKRGDFGIWALPGGRLDSGELLHESAIREVREETGLEIEIERPVGLYFQQGRSRLNVLYRAKPIGGELFAQSDETLDNRFFAPDNLPDDLFGKFYIDHAYTQKTHLHTIETPSWDLLQIDLKLRWRWIQNLLAGHPEPKFPHFTIRAVAVVWHNGKITIQNNELPYVISDGRLSLPESLSIKYGQKLNWQWIGLWQNPKTDKLDFVFHTEHNLKNVQWQNPSELDTPYQRYLQTSNTVWQIT